MKLLFLGDSITQGVGASSEDKNYVNLVKNALGCEVVNYGVSGTRIGRQTRVFCSTMWNYDFRLRAQIMEKRADMVFVFGGTNNSWSATPRGEIKHDGIAPEELYTTFPAICYFMTTLKQDNPDTRVVFLLNTELKPELAECMKNAAERINSTLSHFKLF